MKSYATFTGTCAHCGKLCFITRRFAKQYMTRKFANKPDMYIYRCPGDDRYFHYGHRPGTIRRGQQSRQEFGDQVA